MKDHGIYTFITILWFNSKHSILLNNTARNVGIILTTAYWLACVKPVSCRGNTKSYFPWKSCYQQDSKVSRSKAYSRYTRKNPCRHHHSSIKYKMGIHCHLSGPHHIPQEFANQSEWNTNCLLKSSLYSSSIKKNNQKCLFNVAQIESVPGTFWNMPG